ncbi:MAG: CDP-glycerol glycerophosphotransferase family protein [Propionibacteriaceae bacterium]|jgi:CDP-glycerol glycerophosphotransferase (TagB/SpsB family)|nr:CDP-glycerol glycerophosphotransferase family protein [Propionibacteriaceae bacterium]
MAKRPPKKLIKDAVSLARTSDDPRKLLVFRAARKAARRAAQLLGHDFGWEAGVSSIRWIDDYLEIRGWAFERSVPLGTDLRVWWSGTRLRAEVEPDKEGWANVYSKSVDFSYEDSGFIARFPVAPLLELGSKPHRLLLSRSGHGRGNGPIRRRVGLSTAFNPAPKRVGDTIIELGFLRGKGVMIRTRIGVQPVPEPAVRVDSASVSADGTVMLHGTGAPASLEFRGARAVRKLDVDAHSHPADAATARSMTNEENETQTFTATGSLLAAAWGRPGELPPLGTYLLFDSEEPVTGSADFALTSPHVFNAQGETITLGCSTDRQVGVKFSRDRRDDEIGAYHQEQLRRQYLPPQPLKEQFYFESFFGKQANDNPRGIDRALARLHPDMPRLWGVHDASVPVPEGAIAVVEGSREWWEAREHSRYVVANEWLRTTFTKQPGQQVLQTWHGSMLKRIGLDREDEGVYFRKRVHRETANWSYLLSQNPHSTEIFHSAYDWDGPIWEEGYPRNDLLFTGSGDAIRELLGITGKKVALYAPTWRANGEGVVTFLEVPKLAADLGPEWVVLLRGHSRTLAFGEDVHAPGVLDVTTYPDITELFLAADVLITDYSSVMFDYSNLGRPMIFFVPDLAEYRDEQRGVYFSLEDKAPGPVVFTQAEVLNALQNPTPERYADKYEAWKQRFNPFDGPDCGERIVKRLLSE